MMRHSPHRRLLAFFALALLAAGIAVWFLSGRHRGLDSSATPSPAAATPPSAAGRAPGVGAEQSGGVGAATPTPADVFALLRIEPPPRDLNTLAVRMGRVADTVVEPTPERPRVYRVGDTEMFWLHDINSEQYFKVSAKLEVIAQSAYLWVQAGQRFDAEALARGGQDFSDEVYPRVRAVFGSEWSPGIDGDPRVHILHHEPIAGIAGYFYSADEYPLAVEPHSNRREMFYINLSATTPGAYDYQALLAHEFQHMIHWNEDRDEPVWVNEGLSELAARVAEYPVQTGSSFFDAPDTALLEWEHEAGANGVHYAASYAFFAYLRERFGDGAIRAIVSAPANGPAGVESALAGIATASGGAADAAPTSDAERLPADDAPTFDAVFLDWAAANAILSRPTEGPAARFGYGDLDIGRVRPEPLADDGIATTVSPYGTDYYDVTTRVAGGRLGLAFAGDATVGLLDAVPPRPGAVWWSNRGDNMDARLTRTFDLRGVDSARLAWRTWYDLEANWDYAYYQASVDGGATWTRLATSRTTDANPNGNNFGRGITGTSGGWVDESVDLTAFAGARVAVRFEVVTDDAVSLSGLAIDDIRLDAIAFTDDAEADALDPGAGWEAEGWLRLDPLLPQRWGVQVLVDSPTAGVSARRVDVRDDGRASIDVDDLPADAFVTLAVSALTPATRNAAGYRVGTASGR